jgi:hypothetical protein
MFPIRNGLNQGDAVSPFLLNISFEYAVKCLKLIGTYQFLVFADDVNTMGGSLHTTSIKKNAEALLVSSRETGLKVNDDKTKYVVISRDQNA